jgi:hypothetical protein
VPASARLGAPRPAHRPAPTPLAARAALHPPLQPQGSQEAEDDADEGEEYYDEDYAEEEVDYSRPFPAEIPMEPNTAALAGIPLALYYPGVLLLAAGAAFAGRSFGDAVPGARGRGAAGRRRWQRRQAAAAAGGGALRAAAGAADGGQRRQGAAEAAAAARRQVNAAACADATPAPHPQSSRRTARPWATCWRRRRRARCCTAACRCGRRARAEGPAARSAGAGTAPAANQQRAWRRAAAPPQRSAWGCSSGLTRRSDWRRPPRTAAPQAKKTRDRAAVVDLFNLLVGMEEPTALTPDDVKAVGDKYGLNMQKDQLEGLQQIFGQFLEHTVPTAETQLR